MNIDSNRIVVNLGKGETVSVQVDDRLSVQCLEGPLWITQHRTYQDIVLEEGHFIELSHPGAAVVQALHPASLALEVPAVACNRAALFG